MRGVFLGAAMISALALGACAGVPGAPGGPSVPPSGNVSQIVPQIQQAAVTACAFQPTIATVTSIIGTFTSVGAQIASVNQIAAQICAAIAAPKVSSKRGASKPTFCGASGKCVAIHGKWVSQ